MSRLLGDLYSPLAEICKRHMGIFSAENPQYLCILSHTWRSAEEQDAMFFLGRNADGVVIDPKKVITNARGGQSWHNITVDGMPSSLAYDILLLDIYRRVLSASHLAWQKLGAIGLSLNLDWGVIGRRGLRWDLGHFYLRGSNRITLAEAKSGIMPTL